MNRQERRQAQRTANELVKTDPAAKTFTPAERQWVTDQAMKMFEEHVRANPPQLHVPGLRNPD